MELRGRSEREEQKEKRNGKTCNTSSFPLTKADLTLHSWMSNTKKLEIWKTEIERESSIRIHSILFPNPQELEEIGFGISCVVTGFKFEYFNSGNILGNNV